MLNVDDLWLTSNSRNTHCCSGAGGVKGVIRCLNRWKVSVVIHLPGGPKKVLLFDLTEPKN